jgi:hypothetical protein
MLIWMTGLIVMLGAEEPAPFDPCHVPVSDRLAYFNRLADRVEGSNSLEHYERAVAALEEAERAQSGASDAARAEQRWVENNLDALAQRADWPAEHEPAVRAWLQHCEACLKALQAATDCPRFFCPRTAASGRLADALYSPWLTQQRRLAKRLALQGMRLARAGDWPAAYDANLRILRIAAHAAQPPTGLDQLGGGAIASIASSQLAVFLRLQPPENPRELLKRWQGQNRTEAPEEAIRRAEALIDRDVMEVHYEWAADESRHPDLREQIEIIVNPGEDLEGLFGKCETFRSVDAYRDALRNHALERSWSVFEQQAAFLHRCEDRPLREFLAKRADLQRESRRINGEDPFAALWQDFMPFGRTDVARGFYSNARRAGELLLALHAYRADHRNWPHALAELVPEYLETLPEDSFSDQPFCYELVEDGQSLRLYSVGPDLKDDGGKATEGMGADATGDIVFWPPPLPEYQENPSSLNLPSSQPESPQP